ncbi:hypothetical protein YC2023_059890 [Brassica napus]
MKSVCNLNRVTVPEYLEDGTPKPLDPTSSTKTSSPVSRDVESSVTLANEANNMVRDKEDRDATVTVSHPPTPSVEATSDPILALVATINKPIDKIKDESRMEAKQDTTFSLKERPVKPSTKAKEMQLHSVARGRGNRNRGNRGRNRGGRG